MDRRKLALLKAQRKLESPQCRTLGVELAALLPLPLWEERDLYALLERDVRETAGLTDLIDFPALRMSAEGGTLEDIYDDLSARVMGVNVRAVAGRERALRMRLPVLMQDVHALVRLARGLGKRVVVFAYAPCLLTEAEAAQMLTERGVDAPDALYIGHWSGEVSTADVVLERRTLPSPVDMHRCEVQRLHARQGSFIASGEALRYVGVRAMHAMAALHPSLSDADEVGYDMLGPYLFSQALWLAGEMRRGGFERLVFLARDGYWVKQAFERIAAAMGLDIQTDYVRISRQAAFPLHFRKKVDMLSLPVLTDMTAHTPRTLLARLLPVIDMDAAEDVMRQHGMALDERLSEEEAQRFVQVVSDRLFDEARAEKYRAHAAAYLTAHVHGRCATFDVGYNLRSEAVIRDVTGADVTAFITHADSDVADRRGVPYRAMYPASPWVSWAVREQFLLEDGPACAGYDAGGAVLEADAPVNPAVKRAQEQAITFVEDMLRAFGSYLDRLHFRPVDGCAAFERFLHEGPYRLMKPFKAGAVENAFLTGTRVEDSLFLQWRLMQTDFRAAKKGEPTFVTKLRRGFIRMEEEPESLVRKLGKWE